MCAKTQFGICPYSTSATIYKNCLQCPGIHPEHFSILVANFCTDIRHTVLIRINKTLLHFPLLWENRPCSPYSPNTFTSSSFVFCLSISLSPPPVVSAGWPGTLCRFEWQRVGARTHNTHHFHCVCASPCSHMRRFTFFIHRRIWLAWGSLFGGGGLKPHTYGNTDLRITQNVTMQEVALFGSADVVRGGLHRRRGFRETEGSEWDGRVPIISGLFMRLFNRRFFWAQWLPLDQRLWVWLFSS